MDWATRKDRGCVPTGGVKICSHGGSDFDDRCDDGSGCMQQVPYLAIIVSPHYELRLKRPWSRGFDASS